MIEVEHLTKRFGHNTAVDNISFTVKKGEVLGFLGPNGAGKSTTMRMITGYIPPTDGKISVDGADVVNAPIVAKAKIGYLPEAAPLYADMTVVAFLRFMAELRGKGEEDVERALDTCFLDPVRNQNIDTLSKGYRHRTCLAQSILHDPDILILDEPTDGLDPNQKQEVRSLIKRMGEGKVIIFSTHILEEVEAACTRAIIIDQGRVVADGTPDELKARSRGAGAVAVRITGMAGSGIRSELAGLSGAADVLGDDKGENGFIGKVLPAKSGDSLSKEIFELCKQKQLVLEELHAEPGRLDDVFREITVADTSLSE